VKIIDVCYFVGNGVYLCHFLQYFSYIITLHKNSYYTINMYSFMNCFITLPHPSVSDIYIFWHDNWYLIIRTIMLYVRRQQLKQLKQPIHITDIALFVCFDYKWKELSQLYLQWTYFGNKTNVLHTKRVNKYTIQKLSTNWRKENKIYFVVIIQYLVLYTNTSLLQATWAHKNRFDGPISS
jgi:hypothetical protein